MMKEKEGIVKLGKKQTKETKKFFIHYTMMK